MSSKADNTGEIAISRARYNEIQLYEISEDELTQIEAGSPTSNYLNFAISLLSVGISLLTSLLTTTIEDDRVFLAFLCTTIITSILGIILLIIWLRTNKTSKKIFQRIRARKEPSAIREAVDQSTRTEPTEHSAEES